MSDDGEKEDDSNVVSPCIRQCCLNEHDVCLGCFRTLDEILKWSESSNDKRKDVLKSCARRKGAHSDLGTSG
ncbi:DUF1289 domain-containing protein [Vibrio profundum]|uniref:DUF1289 domain-containing protein n=1 Tax=Vibrio profundum TaxID=2910247 RepID=UPI003D1010B9